MLPESGLLTGPLLMHGNTAAMDLPFAILHRLPHWQIPKATHSNVQRLPGMRDRARRNAICNSDHQACGLWFWSAPSMLEYETGILHVLCNPIDRLWQRVLRRAVKRCNHTRSTVIPVNRTPQRSKRPTKAARSKYHRPFPPPVTSALVVLTHATDTYTTLTNDACGASMTVFLRRLPSIAQESLASRHAGQYSASAHPLLHPNATDSSDE